MLCRSNVSVQALHTARRQQRRGRLGWQGPPGQNTRELHKLLRQSMNDEALARQLQAEEDAAFARLQQQAAAHHLRGGQGTAAFARQVEAAVSKVLGYEDRLAQAKALSVMPLARLEAAAEEAVTVSAAMGEQPPLAREDALALELLAWFKGTFFSWVNSPPCDACGSPHTRGTGVAAPTDVEAAHGAGRTELYCCDQCGGTTRFPRYNDPVKLLETRRGRCGEWANCFALCCRAAGLDVRLAQDWGDHIWVEQWSPAQQRWVHLDPCEAAADKPLLYEAGWGKQLSYVIAVGRYEASDVTRRYTRHSDQLSSRRHLVREDWLADLLRHITARLRAPLPSAQRRQLERRDEQDQQALSTASSQPLSAPEAALPARQTGDAAWLAARGEDGAAAPRAAAAAVPPPGTRYRMARDDHLRAKQPARVCGGAVRASGENGPSEAAARAFDGDPSTKWLDFGGAQHNGAWLEYRLPAEAPPVVLGAYALTSANDSPERDPRHVALEAWAEGGESWVVLDEQQSLSFPRRHQRLVLRVPYGGGRAPRPSRRFRLRVVQVADPASANSVQLACLDLFALPQQALAAGRAAAAAGQQQRQGEERAAPQVHPDEPQQAVEQQQAAPEQQQPAAQQLTPCSATRQGQELPVQPLMEGKALRGAVADAAEQLQGLHLQPGGSGSAVKAAQPGAAGVHMATAAAGATSAGSQAGGGQGGQPAGGASQGPAAEENNPWAALFDGHPPAS